ncbi:MAG: GNAT family N-acetyltransferase [Acidimicrobiales bacterium]|nr:GNAT family N-acetyltransferase [Acidimicrobiales bacterium]
MDAADPTIESLRAGDEAIRWDLGRQAFGSTDPFDPDRPGVVAERAVAAYAGDRLAGQVVTIDFSMQWGGVAVPCGGVSGVVVRPEDRGHGLAKAMLRESFDRMRHRGEVVAALYPTTATLYRSVGFEIVGSHDWRKVPLHLIPTEPASGLRWRRVEFGDPAVRTVYESMATTLDGWFLPGDTWWGRTIHSCENDTRKNRYAYVGARDGVDVAAAIYRYDTSDDRLYELGVDLLAGVDASAVAAALGFLAGNATTAGYLETTLPVELLGLHIPDIQHAAITNDWPWMLRLIDVAGAFAARRFSGAVSGRVELHIDDPTIPDNAGPHLLEVSGGSAHVTPGGSGQVQVSVNDLARIYAGNDVRLLHSSGRLPGATAHDVAFLAAACASSPTMPFFF